LAVSPSSTRVKVATFNVSIEASNYGLGDFVADHLTSGKHPQIQNIAQIIKHIAPDIILLNEFEYIETESKGIDAFVNNYLKPTAKGNTNLDYPFRYVAPVNTGLPTGVPRQYGKLSHFGFGRVPGQYGMALLSKYPIEKDNVRTFQHFLWKDMPNHRMPSNRDGSPWYSEVDIKIMRLSSKSHWDIPVTIGETTVHILASHPTPPVFDGPERRNQARNHDEIRFWIDYLHAAPNSYHYDDNDNTGGIKPNSPFILLGDLNACVLEGDADKSAIKQLLTHEKVNANVIPASRGAARQQPNNLNAKYHTAGWGMRADYVLPSYHFEVAESGVFWPEPGDPLASLVENRKASSDHRLVWLELKI
jgi:endonuclease/exonuclease/phosphatase family metal-dependent hydrolase